MLSTRSFHKDEQQQLYDLLDHPDPQVHRRAKAVLLSAEGYSANQMVPLVNLTAKSIRKWITRFNSEGVAGLVKQAKSPGRKPTFTPAKRQKMVELALTPPQSLGQPFTTWSLDKLVAHLRETEGIRISKSWLSQILRENGLSPQRVKTWIASPDPDYALKKNGSRSSSLLRRRGARSSSLTRSGRRR